MPAFRDSYVMRVLLAPRGPARGLGAVARRWRRMLDQYRPELHYMRGPGPKWRERHARDKRAAGFAERLGSAKEKAGQRVGLGGGCNACR
jgi:hypothetical protein